MNKEFTATPLQSLEVIEEIGSASYADMMGNWQPAIEVIKQALTPKLDSKVEEAINELKTLAMSSNDQKRGLSIGEMATYNIQLIKQALSDKDEEIKGRKDVEQSLSKMVIEQDNKLNAIEEVVKDVAKRSRYNLMEDLYNANDEIVKKIGGTQ